MSRDSAILDHLFALTRGDLEQAEPPLPRFGEGGWRLQFLKVGRVASFWKPDERDARVPFEQGMEDLVTGFFGLRLTWALLIEGDTQAIKVGFGAESAEGVAALRSSLMGALPDVRLGTGPVARDAELSRFVYGAQVTGCPTGKTETARGVVSDQIERLCRGLFGERWAYLVVATPVEPAETTRRINEVAQDIRAAHETLLLKGSAADEHNRLARHYVELLEAKFRRLQSGRSGGMWQVGAYLLAESPEVLGRGGALLTAAFAGEKSLPDPLRVRPCRAVAGHVEPSEPLSSHELAVLAAIPREEYPGYEVVDQVRFGVETGQQPGRDRVVIGAVLDRGHPTGTRFEVSRDQLTRHGLIVGVTGSGKTNTCFGLLDQLWDGGRGVPFLVIESAKSEYRALLKEPRFSGIRVFTIGDETVSPFRLNPFEVPPGVLVQTHIDYLKALFAAAFVLFPPMPYVLEQSLQEIYQDRGWDLAQNVNRRGADSPRALPSLDDLYAKIGTVIDRMGYDAEITMNVRSGLQARINQLRIGGGKGLMLSTRRSVPMEDLFEAPCILELKQIVSDDEKAFLMGLVLIRLYERYEAGRLPARSGLRHVTLIEEAHRLLRNVSTERGSEVSANPKGHAIEVFANILSEIRAYGEGILIAEQVPVKLAPDAIKNTNLKIVHRLLAEDDRKAVGGTIGLSESQSRYLPSLGCGEAVAFAEGMRKPVLVSIPLAPAKAGQAALSDAEVRGAMAPYWRERAGLRLRYSACARCATTGDTAGCERWDSVLEDGTVRPALYRFFGTMLHTPGAALEAFGDVLMALQPYRDSAVAPAPYCVLVQFIEETVEGRGAFYGWPYIEVKKAVSLACSAAWALAAAAPKDAEGAPAPPCAQDLAALAELVRGLCARERGPFAACRHCQVRCEYRFEIDRLEREAPSHGQDFRAVFHDPGVSLDELARLAWDAAGTRFDDRDPVVRRGAAFCFVAQQLARLGRPLSGQERVGLGLLARIAERGERRHG